MIKNHTDLETKIIPNERWLQKLQQPNIIYKNGFFTTALKINNNIPFSVSRPRKISLKVYQD